MKRDPQVMEKARAKRLRRMQARTGQAKAVGLCFTQKVRTLTRGVSHLVTYATQAFTGPAAPSIGADTNRP